MLKRFFSTGTIMAVMVLLSFVFGGKVYAAATPPAFNNDITTQVNVSVTKFSYFYSGAENEVIDNDTILKPSIDLANNISISLKYSWTLPDGVDINEGDYFTIPLPKNCEFSVVGLDITKVYQEIEDPKNPGQRLGYWKIIENDKTTDTGDYCIQFVVHSDFAYTTMDRGGFFELAGRTLHDGKNDETITMTIGPYEVEANFPKVESTDITTMTGFPGERYINADMPNMQKFANGRIGNLDTTPTGEWIVRFGYDDYKSAVALSQSDTFNFHQNVIIRDELFDEGQTFHGLSLRVPIFRPANADGAATNQIPTLKVINGEMKYMNQEDGIYADTDAWEQAIRDSSVPAWGMSTNRKIAVVNLGTIGSNGIYYAADNAAYEKYLRDMKKLTNDEIEALMKTVGYNGAHTLSLYDGSTKNIVIDNLIQNRVLAYFVGFNVYLENVPGREYTNQVTATYDGGVFDTQLALNRMYISSSSAGAAGVADTGNIYLNKYDQDTYPTTKTPIDQAEFELYRMSGSTPVLVQTKETSETGAVSFEGLTQGKYRLYETKATGYDTTSLSLFKRGADGKYTAYTDTAGDNYFEFELTTTELYLYFEATNLKAATPPPVTGNVLLSKVDQANTATMLSGASFTLTAQDGTIHMSIPDTTTGVYSFSSIPLGIYTIEETIAPTNYDIKSFAGITDIDGAMAGIQIEVTGGSPILLTATNASTLPPILGAGPGTGGGTGVTPTPTPTPAPTTPPTVTTPTAPTTSIASPNQTAITEVEGSVYNNAAVPDTSDSDEQIVFIVCGTVALLAGIAVALTGRKPKNKRNRTN